VKTTIKNYMVDSTPTVLGDIHQTDVNIAIYTRDISSFTDEINALVKEGVEIELNGGIDTILIDLTRKLNPIKYQLLLRDIKNLLFLFKRLTNANGFRFQLASIDTNMCPRFHADMNELRMLCTYFGPGTLWLPDHAADRQAYLNGKGNGNILSDENLVQQANSGDVIILKGALYPGGTPILHRSPNIESPFDERILLTIDPNASISPRNK